MTRETEAGLLSSEPDPLAKGQRPRLPTHYCMKIPSKSQVKLF